jgi:hypothetical protein
MSNSAKPTFSAPDAAQLGALPLLALALLRPQAQ